MEVKGLFEAFAGYLNFAIDFLLFQGMEEYERLGTINPTLVSFCVAGVFVAYLIGSAKKIPGYDAIHWAERSSWKGSRSSLPAVIPKASTKDTSKEDSLDMARFLLLSVAGALTFHVFLVFYSYAFSPPRPYTVKDTLNAMFAYNAVYHPWAAFTKQIQRGLNFIAGANISRAATLVAALLLFALALLHLFSARLSVVFAECSARCLHEVLRIALSRRHRLWLYFLCVALCWEFDCEGFRKAIRGHANHGTSAD